MPAFEVNGGGYVGLQRLLERNIIRGSKLYKCFQQFSPGWMMHGFIQLLVLRNKYDLSTGYLFLVVFVVMETTLHWFVIGQQSKRRFFFRKVKLFSTWKDASSYRKERRLRWCYKKCSGLFWKHGILHRIIMQNRCWQLKKRGQVWK